MFNREGTKSYHSHEVFNFGLFHPNLPLLPDLLDGEEAGSLVRLEDGAHQKSAHLIPDPPGEGGRVNEGAATERVILLARCLRQAFDPLLLLDRHRVST